MGSREGIIPHHITCHTWRPYKRKDEFVIQGKNIAVILELYLDCVSPFLRIEGRGIVRLCLQHHGNGTMDLGVSESRPIPAKFATGANISLAYIPHAFGM